ncbi:hypothetical protein ABOM_006118 [Aspergillus bombycis]|uniref:Cytochrome P450 n=1 Tax=Aspergillus bombycis TaxID=109264 RepID=A0A1F7ZZG2_9EURO|nr:hypothetical protein ABOM_006118 [Aspergillus bombycis]OGM44850.1 hypothetical protein ABOM_006118 [Aspergillus bombycis]
MLKLEGLASWVVIIICCYLCQAGLKVLYRLHFHPLKNFPGPWLAAATGWYKFYYDVIRGGQYIFHIWRLEKEFNSTIIRISHNHLLINDPDFFHDVFKPGTEFQRDPTFYQSLPLANSLAALADFKLHGVRRKQLNPVFTPSAVAEALPTLSKNIEGIGEILSRAKRDGTAVDIQAHFFYLTINMISDKLFGSSLSLLDEKDQLDDIATTLQFFHRQSLLFVNFPSLGKLVDVLPEFLLRMVVPGYVRLREYCGARLGEVYARRQQKEKPSPDAGHRTLNDVLLESGQSDGIHIDRKYLIDESVLFMFVGTDTTAYALSFAIYYLLTHPDVLKKLKVELRDSERQIQSHDWPAIRKLEYLSAVIEEVLRISCPVQGFLPRVVPPSGRFIGSTFIPGGTIISVPLSGISKSEVIFKDPGSFRPERWLGDEGKSLEKWRVQFSLGPYACIGMKLSQMEMTMSLAYIFARFDLALHETDSRSMEILDYLLAANTSHVQVTVLKDNWS